MITVDQAKRRAFAARRVSRMAARFDVARRDRDDAIRAMRDDGGTLREIAEAAGMSHAGIARILVEEVDTDAVLRG